MAYSRRGRPPKISEIEKSEIREKVTTKEPIQLCLGYAFWTSTALQEYIKRDWKITISQRKASNYLKEWKLTTHRRQRAYEFEERIAAEWYRNNLHEITDADKLDSSTLERAIKQKAREYVAKQRDDMATAKKQAVKMRNSLKKRTRNRPPKVIKEPNDFIPLKIKKRRNVGTTALEMEIKTGRLKLEDVLNIFSKYTDIKPVNSRPVKHEEEIIECVDNFLFHHHHNRVLFPRRPFR